MIKVRGFEVVSYENDIMLPIRADDGSAGYDFFLPHDVTIQANSGVIILSGVKAYMKKDEVLYIHIRSNLGIKKGVLVANTVGVIDSTYYDNPDNEGNIGIALKNTTNHPVTFLKGERVVQGVFHTFLTADNDKVLHGSRTGGIGSSGK